jgi:hypothetical protein
MNSSSKAEALKSKVLSNPRRYFFRILTVCFLLGLIGVGASVGSERRIHPEWSAAMFGLFGIGISFAYAAFLAFAGVGCSLLMACNNSAWIKWLLRSLGITPVILSGIMLASLHFGGGDPVARLMSLLPFMQGIVIGLLLGVVLLSCLGWKLYAKRKRMDSSDGR